MAFNVEPYKGKVDPRSATLSRSRGGGGELDEMQQLFEQLMGGEELEEGEEIDWEEMWNTVMGAEPEYEEEQQGSYQPTMFGSPIRPGGVKSPFGAGIYY